MPAGGIGLGRLSSQMAASGIYCPRAIIRRSLASSKVQGPAFAFKIGICCRASKLAAKAILVSALPNCQIPAAQPIATTSKADTVATMRLVMRAVNRLFKRFKNKGLR